MRSIDILRGRYDLHRRRLPFHAIPQIGDDGLMFGRGSLLIRFKVDDGQKMPDHDLDRFMVLICVAYSRQASPMVAKHVSRALGYWRGGNKALAHIELSFARLPRLDGEDAAFRLFLAETLLDEGLTPQDLARGLGLNAKMIKYDPGELRVPVGNGRESGRWGSATGQQGPFQDNRAKVSIPPSDAPVPPEVAPPSQAEAPPLALSFLTDTNPGIVRTLAIFATRFTIPTAILGALIIPTPNSGGVTVGTLPDAPDIRYRRDGPAGTLQLSRTDADGNQISVLAHNRRGIYVDVATDKPLGRDFGEQFYLDLATVVAVLAPYERGKPAATSDEPQLCPAPVRDVANDPKVHTLDYEDDVHKRVNPLLPIPRGFAVQIIDPKTGIPQYPDDCFRYAGDLVDGDMRVGDFADAKGEEYSRLLLIPGVGDSVMEQIKEVTKRHLRAAEARGARLKVYFAERAAADKVRERFALDEELLNVVVGFLPPSKPKQRSRSR